MVWPIMFEKSVFGRDVRLRAEASQSRLAALGEKKHSRILFRDQDLFLAQEIEVLVTAGTRVDDGGKVLGKIVGVTTVRHWKSEWYPQRDLSGPDEFAVSPKLTKNRDFTTRSNCIQERFAVASKSCTKRRNAGKQQDASPVGGRDLINSSLFSSRCAAKQVLPAGVNIGNKAAVVHELLRIRAVHAPFPNSGYRTHLLHSTHVNRFLVRAPHRIYGLTSHLRELMKSAAISGDDIDFGP